MKMVQKQGTMKTLRAVLNPIRSIAHAFLIVTSTRQKPQENDAMQNKKNKIFGRWKCYNRILKEHVYYAAKEKENPERSCGKIL